MKNVPIALVDYFQTLYSAARSKPGCDLVEVKTKEDFFEDSQFNGQAIFHSYVTWWSVPRYSFGRLKGVWTLQHQISCHDCFGIAHKRARVANYTL